MVVGGGNSGVQIAVELARAHKVSMALGYAPTILPQRVFRRNIFDVLEYLQLFKVPTASPVGRFLRLRDPVIGTSLRAEGRAGQMRLLRRVVNTQGRQLYIGPGEAILSILSCRPLGFVQTTLGSRPRSLATEENYSASRSLNVPRDVRNVTT